MLRMSYMPSDFHPLLLVLGRHDDIAALGAVLGRFAASGEPVALAASGAVFSTDTEVHLSRPAGDARRGLWPGAAPGHLDWTLTADEAEAFASELEELAADGAPAGSVTLECEVLNEIRVRVSVGEWEDHYLTDDIR